MTLVLYVKDGSVKTFEDRGPLEGLKTTIEASLTDDHGKETCHGLGQPGPGNRDGMWVLMERGDESGYWHWQCAHVRVHSNVKTFRRHDSGKNATGSKHKESVNRLHSESLLRRASFVT